MSRREVADVIREAQRIAVAFHRQPDGDALGSALALHLGLKALGKKSQVIGTGPVPGIFSFLPGFGEISDWTALAAGVEVVVLVDVGDPSLIEAGYDWRAIPARLAVVDHHGSNPGFGHWNWVDPRAAAVGELVYDLLEDLGVAIDATLALPLYVSLYSDTGGFRYSNTRPRTHELAARFLAAGVSAGEVSRRLEEEYSAASRRLLGRALAKLRLTRDGKLAWSELDARDFRIAGAVAEDADGIVGFLRTIGSVQLAILFRPDGEGGTRVAFRSKEPVNAADLAAKFGGGGHPRAAGARLDSPLREARRRVLQEAEMLWRVE